MRGVFPHLRWVGVDRGMRRRKTTLHIQPTSPHSHVNCPVFLNATVGNFYSVTVRGCGQFALEWGSAGWVGLLFSATLLPVFRTIHVHNDYCHWQYIPDRHRGGLCVCLSVCQSVCLCLCEDVREYCLQYLFRDVWWVSLTYSQHTNKLYFKWTTPHSTPTLSPPLFNHCWSLQKNPETSSNEFDPARTGLGSTKTF